MCFMGEERESSCVASARALDDAVVVIGNIDHRAQRSFTNYKLISTSKINHAQLTTTKRKSCFRH